MQRNNNIMAVVIIACLIVLYVIVDIGTKKEDKPVKRMDVSPTYTYEEEQQVLAEKASVEACTTEFVKEVKEEPTEVTYKCYTHGIYSITPTEFDLMARVVMSESGGEDFNVQLAVAETILNRVVSDNFPNTIEEVIRQDVQYSIKDNGEPTTSVLEAVQTALEEQTYPGDMYFFRENYYHGFSNDYKKLGKLYFSRGVKDNG